MSNPTTFIDHCLAGSCVLSDIDDWVDRWHDSDSPATLPDFLGMTDEEYAIWVERSESLALIIHARKRQIPLLTLLSHQNTVKFAARAADPTELKKIQEWLKRTGRI